MSKDDFSVLATCPFCLRAIKCVPGGDVPRVEHALPACKTFNDAEDALDFVEKCNDKLGTART